jgi:hypothetical protein
VNVEITKKEQLLGTIHAHALARSHCCYTTLAHMRSLHALQQRISIGGRYVPKYFLKQTILDTWNHTIEGYMHLGTFTQDPNDCALHIANPDPTMCQGVGRHKKKRIRNNMDEAEAGPQVQICSKCNNS